MNKRYFPQWLKDRKIWVLWRLEERNGYKAKVPYSACYYGRASSTAPSSWSTFSEAENLLSRSDYDGIGAVITPGSGLVFIDVDHCFNGWDIDERGQDITAAFADYPTYMERSQSGTGLHIFALGTIPRSFHNKKLDVEMYDCGRFCAMTGNAIEPFAVDVAEAQPALDYVFEKYHTVEAEKHTHSPNPTAGSIALAKDDKWVIERASSHGGKFPDLYAGNYEKAGYQSHSEADEALCVLLCFWTDADPGRMDTLFRSSGLFREKWERDDYRERTISSAIAHCEETLSECIARKREAEARLYESAFIQRW